MKTLRTLMNTFAWAFYLEACSQREMFELNQEKLELLVEDLSKYLEQVSHTHVAHSPMTHTPTWPTPL